MRRPRPGQGRSSDSRGRRQAIGPCNGPERGRGLFPRHGWRRRLLAVERDGRIMWLLWTGGNDRFWDYMVEPTFGTFDLLKIVAPDPKSLNARPHRWQQLGIVNEPVSRRRPAATPTGSRPVARRTQTRLRERSIRGRAALSRVKQARAEPVSRTAERCRSARFTATPPVSSA